MTVATIQATRSKTLDVLIVDDDQDVAGELVDYLSRTGLSCDKAPDGWAALKLLANGVQAGVVVSDLRMPELDGVQFAEHLQKRPDRERPEIIFMSGNPGYDDAVEAIRLQARDMLTKPIDGPRLVRSVKSALLVRELRLGTPDVTKASPEKSPIERKRATLENLRAVRKVRSKYFPSELFSDPCWEMLLDLYDALLAGQETTVTSLAAASGAATTTAWRRISSLQSHGLIERIEDTADKRRTIIRLSDAGLKAVENFFDTYSRRSEG